MDLSTTETGCGTGAPIRRRCRYDHVVRSWLIALCGPALLAGAAWACGEQLAIQDVPDGPDANAVTEGGVPEGASSLDATSDAGAPFACAAGDMLCADFEGATVNEGWTEIRQVGDASVALDEGSSVSPTHVFLSSATQASTVATLVFAAVQSPYGYDTELAFHVDESDQGAKARILTLTTAEESTLRLELTKETTSSYGLTVYRRVGTAADSELLTTVSGQTWVHLLMRVRLQQDGGFGAATIVLNGKVVYAAPMRPRTSTGPKLEVGVDKGSIPAGRMRVRFDNVRMRALD